MGKLVAVPLFFFGVVLALTAGIVFCCITMPSRNSDVSVQNFYCGKTSWLRIPFRRIH